MKILYDHQIFTAQKYGGISRYYYELISRLSSNNEISLCMGYYVNRYGLEKYQHTFKKYFGTKRPVIPKTGRLFNVFNSHTFNGFTKRISDVEVYHPTYYSYLFPDFKGKRAITVHDLIHELFPEHFSTNDLTISLKKNLINNCEGIICVSKATKDDLMSLYNISEEKVKVIYLSNSLKASVSDNAIVGEPYILYVGARRGYKNFTLLLNAYINVKRICRQYKIVCFGGGPVSKEENEIIQKHNLETKVLFYSGTDDDLSNLYNYASVFVLPSLYEGFGIPPLEAMYYGCPVLASNCSSIPEVVGNAGLYFDPSSVEDLSSKLDYVLGYASYRKKLIKLGYQQVEKFSWDRCAEETLDFYNSLL